ncbi:MAG: hypothetical protein QM500_15965 [Methylococcales bacterium]
MRSIRRRFNNKNRLAIILVYLALLILFSGGLIYSVSSNLGVVTADKYGCYPDMQQRHIHMVVDASNPRYNIEQQRGIYRYTEQLYNGLELGDKLSVYTSEGNQVASIAKSKFHICGQAKTADELVKINAAEASKGYLAKQQQRLYQKVFLPKLKALLTDPLNDEQVAKSSPILEMIADLSRLPSMKAGSKLVVVSDLFQFSSSVKPFCLVKNALPAFSSFAQWPVYKTLLKPQRLAGIETEMLMLQRQSYGKFCTERELRQWWIDYFKDNSGKNPSVIRIRTGG